ncbi:CDP-diacylglycerol--glycerol-3-phosphate 3-phosphatidyltransferase [Candidatus Aerophobetes bacterium]|nr:CDP-diacylglycerol--glycerol-3-phosphate 3-phosphatidyltransferase [Candidatus Aerophobetes bacterium]
MNLANKITFFRIILIPFFILFLFFWGKVGVALSFLIFLIASFSDWMDGYIARRKSQITSLGKIMDPVADKILVYSAFICFIHFKIIPFWMIIILMARDFLVMALRAEAAYRGVLIVPTFAGKFKTFLEYGGIVSSFFYLLFSSIFLKSFFRFTTYFFMSLAVSFALISGFQYFLQGKKVISS